MNKPLSWGQIKEGNIPTTSGIYAWYYRNKIGNADINDIENKLLNISGKLEKKKFLESVFQKLIFDKFNEEPYSAKISGKLKPTYIGCLSHEYSLSGTFIDRLLGNEESVKDVLKELNEIDVMFSSPIYIGMATNLLQRVLKHKDGIISAKAKVNDITDYPVDVDENSFANRFTNRNLDSTNLYLTFKEINSEKKIHNSMEYILNRVNYPLLGRN